MPYKEGPSRTICELTIICIHIHNYKCTLPRFLKPCLCAISSATSGPPFTSTTIHYCSALLQHTYMNKDIQSTVED